MARLNDRHFPLSNRSSLVYLAGLLSGAALAAAVFGALSGYPSCASSLRKIPLARIDSLPSAAMTPRSGAGQEDSAYLAYFTNAAWRLSEPPKEIKLRGASATPLWRSHKTPSITIPASLLGASP